MFNRPPLRRWRVTKLVTRRGSRKISRAPMFLVLGIVDELPRNRISHGAWNRFDRACGFEIRNHIAFLRPSLLLYKFCCIRESFYLEILLEIRISRGGSIEKDR